MVARNGNLAKLQGGYLFPEINRRKKSLLQRQPDAKIISLGIGNTTEPLSPSITSALENAARGMGTTEGYSGYGDEQGMEELRQKIASEYYTGLPVASHEVFVSDGAKCDIGRLQVLFGPRVSFAVQDPSYPVYVDGGVILGQTGALNVQTKQFEGIRYLPCLPENNFFPDLRDAHGVDVLYICSPNNPTGAVATRAQLEQLVQFAKEEQMFVVFDAAYAMFIKDPELPKSIYEIPEARQVAIEVNSLSKPAGFTGVRLGWTVVPDELKYRCGTPVIQDWNRIMTTIFNGASNIVQLGAIAAFSEEGRKEMHGFIDFYLENARIIREALVALDYECFGGDNAPYIWARTKGQGSWEAFEEILEKAHVVTTPGAGFGPAGEGFLRFSAFGHRGDVLEAVERLKGMGG